MRHGSSYEYENMISQNQYVVTVSGFSIPVFQYSSNYSVHLSHLTNAELILTPSATSKAVRFSELTANIAADI